MSAQSPILTTPNFAGEFELEMPRLELELATNRPFGDPGYINACTHSRYERRLEMLASSVPAAATLLETVRLADDEKKHRVMGDPAVRIAINLGIFEFQRRATSGVAVADILSTLDAASAFLTDSVRRPPLQAGALNPAQLPAPFGNWVWTSEREDDAPARIVLGMYEHTERGRTVLRTPGAGHLAVLEAGTRLLSDTIPLLAGSALDHAHLVAVVGGAAVSNPQRRPFKSFTIVTMPGTIFLDASVLANVWQAAEALLHESLHHKLYDLQHSHSILRRGYLTTAAPKIRAPWNRSFNGSNEWPVDRALAAFHVYVHLAFLFSIIERRSDTLERAHGPFGSFNPSVSARQALDRAQYLGSELGRHRGELGVAGQRFLEWMSDILGKCDPKPPALGARVHLTLDLYNSETGSIAAAVLERRSEADAAQFFRERTAWEIRSLHEFAARFGIEAPRLSGAVADGGPADAYRETRGLVLKYLTSISAGRDGSRELEETIERLVTASGDLTKHGEIIRNSMDIKMENPDVSTQVEAALAESTPFGAGDFINRCTWARYRQRLEALAAFLPEAAAALTAFDAADVFRLGRVIADPTVRMAINQALAHFKLGVTFAPIDELAAMIGLTSRHLTEDLPRAPLEVGVRTLVRIGPLPHHSWVWTEDRREDAASGLFRRTLLNNLGPAGITLRTPSARALDMLIQGARLLDELLPRLGRSALTHAPVIATVNHAPGFMSVTNPKIPGTIFLSETLLEDPWTAAEYLLHESLHQKFLDLEHTQALLLPAHASDHWHIRPPWRRPIPSNPYNWPLSRCLTVCHVYSCLAVFFNVVSARKQELAREYGAPPVNSAVSARQALDRAEYLAGELVKNAAYLGSTGRDFVQWMSESLRRLDPAAAPPGASVHLLLDLYERESDALGSLIANASPETLRLPAKTGNGHSGGAKGAPAQSENPTVAELVIRVVHREASAAADILATFAEKSAWLKAFAENGSPADAGPAELARRFWGARALVSRNLRRIPLASYAVATESERVREMVLSSTDELEAIRKGLSN